MVKRREAKQRKMEDAWQVYNGSMTRRWGYGTFQEAPTEDGHQELIETEEDFSIVVQFPGKLFGTFGRVPRKSTWAHFKALVGHYAGEGEWCAGSDEELWCNHERTPPAGQLVEVAWIVPDKHDPK
jgi:hypothetical protein